jgi:hypothetical protein
MFRTKLATGKTGWEAPALLFLLMALVLPAAAQQRLGLRELPMVSSGRPMAILGSSVEPQAQTLATSPQLQSEQPERAGSAASRLAGEVRISQTPFAQQVSMPLARFWHGHMQITGFTSSDSMENLLWGPPASGNLPARGVTTQSHIGVWAPGQNQSYGLTLTLHRGAAAATGHALRPDQWIFQALRRRRS